MTESELTGTASPDGCAAAPGAPSRTALRARPDASRWPENPEEPPGRAGRAEAVDPPGVRRSGPRARCFDAAVRAYVARHPEATVVALGEGLGTGYWRLDNGRLHWLSVLPPRTAAVRRMLLPDGARRRTVVRPERGNGWLDAVRAPERGVIVTAPGLPVRLAPQEVRELLAACAERLPGGALVFDALPHRAAALSRRCTSLSGGRWPAPVRWGLDRGQLAAVASVHPAITAVRELPLPGGRGALPGAAGAYGQRFPVLRSWTPVVCEVRFGRA
ncbi:class I SAM-dependent methyltransferase [Streptomyces pinistramenti]|uniref:class I SAM-dependent methyltransferase n=1 Tax=Streptomyces pinistramenti TaxID=2884812 RepID=UPI001D05FE29|nr:class I SAM-dependent methyltransferase [Streptomyces pinistramenti]MCB5909629.1 class I SAM-dependent methyltransferase [Streptomyces pinistramenti]